MTDGNTSVKLRPRGRSSGKKAAALSAAVTAGALNTSKVGLSFLSDVASLIGRWRRVGRSQV